MLNHTDFDIHLERHARQVARVNAVEWMCPASTRSARSSPRARLGSALIALGERLAPTSVEAS